MLPLKYIDSHPYGEVVSRVIADVDQFADGLLMGFSQLFTGVITILGTLIFMLTVNVGITFVVVLLTPLSLFVANFIARRTFSMFKKQSEARAEQTALVQALRRGTPLQDEQKKLIAPVRGEIITVYRELQTRRWHAEDLQPLFAKLGEQQTGKTLVALTALEQVGLIAAVEHGGAKFWELVPTAGKKNLADAPILKCLEGE